VAVVGIGADVVDVARFSVAIARTPGFADRVLLAGEQSERTASMAARFAAKEALAKALGAPRGLRWHDAEVVCHPDGRPTFAVRGSVAAACQRRDVSHVHLTLSHDGGLALAVVVLES